MTIKDAITSLSNTSLEKTKKLDKFPEKDITNHTNESYTLDISLFAMKQLYNMEKVELAIINSNTLSYDDHLNLIMKSNNF